ncbi:hypothetical protein BH23VER1_BH23VER1_37580 [soil metagenome]
MRKALTLVSTLLALGAHSASAHVGGPFSFNDHGGNQSGVYQAVITMKNGNGACRFSEGQEPQISIQSTSIIFFRGIVYAGTCFGIVDKNAKYVQGTTNGRSNVSSTSSSNALDNIGSGNFLFLGDTAGLSSESQAIGVQSGAGGNIGICNTSWTGKVTDTSPIVEFRAKGVAYFFGELDAQVVVTSTIANTREVNNDIVDAIASIAASLTGGAILSSFNDISIDELINLVDLSTASGTASSSANASSGGQSKIFPDIGVQVPVTVFGSQISYDRVAAVTPQEDGLSGTGSGAFFF